MSVAAQVVCGHRDPEHFTCHPICLEMRFLTTQPQLFLKCKPTDKLVWN